MTKVAMGLMDKGRLIDRIFPYFSDDIADEVIEELISLVEYFNKPLSANILLKVLYNVRK